MSRYTEAPQEVLDVFEEVLDEYFPELRNCYVKILMDSKKRKSKGSYTFASIKKLNDREKYLSIDNHAPNGYDYLMVIDGNIWGNITKDDKVRIIRHELRHVDINTEKKDPYQIVDHDVNDFMEEIKLNKDDPEWSVRVTDIASSIYEKDK